MQLIEKNNLTVIRKKGKIISYPYLAMKDAILGTSYDLTIVFCTPEESRVRNMLYRQKNYPTNVLSFPLSKKEGEIYLCLSIVRKGAKDFDMSYHQFLQFLIIHGMLHLKGYDHSSTMERLERKYLQQFFRGT